MAKAKTKEETAEQGELLAALDARLAEHLGKVEQTVREQVAGVDKRIDGLAADLAAQEKKTRAAFDRVGDAIEELSTGGSLDDLADDDDDDELPEVREYRRIMGRNTPENIGEIARALRERGQRLRTDGLRFASAQAKIRGEQSGTLPGDRAPRINMSGEKTVVRDHTGEIVARGQKRPH